MPYIIQGLWIPSIVLGWLACLNLFRNRLAGRYWMLVVFLIGHGCMSGLRVTVYLFNFYGDWHRVTYPEVWDATQPLTFVLDAAVALSAFHAIARHFPGMYPTWAYRIMAALGALALGTLGISMSTNPDGPMGMALYMTRNSAMFWLGFTALVMLFFYVQFREEVPIPSNALNHVTLTLGFFAGITAGNFLASLPEISERFSGQVILQFVGIFCFSGWLLTITPRGEELSLPGNGARDANVRLEIA